MTATHLSPAEERTLIALAQADDVAARQRLIAKNMGFVYKCAGEFPPKYRDDLVGEGVIGFVEAIGRFDLSRNLRLLTYAGWYIRKWMQEYVARNASLVSSRTAYQQDGSYAASVRVLVDAGLSRAEAVREVAKTKGETEACVRDHVERYTLTFARHASFDAPMSADGATTLADVLGDGAESIELRLGDAETEHWVRETVASLSLSPIEQAIVETRLMGGETLEVVAKRFRLSRERIRQIQDVLVKKLRRRFAREPDAWLYTRGRPLLKIVGSRVEFAEHGPKPAPEDPLCRRCTHPESWHVGGIWANEPNLRLCRCGCEDFSPKGATLRVCPNYSRMLDELELTRLLSTDDAHRVPKCPALLPMAKRACNRPAVWKGYCVIHGQRIDRGIEVRVAGVADAAE